MARLLDDPPGVTLDTGGVRVGLVPGTAPGLDRAFFVFLREIGLNLRNLFVAGSPAR